MEQQEKKERHITHNDIMAVFYDLYRSDSSLRLRVHKNALYLLSVVSRLTSRELFYGRWLNREEIFDLLNREWLELQRIKQDIGLEKKDDDLV